ncbi:MAG: hypothetical protein LUC17_01295 [Oscillospiraceae bacterium]|nr:hypothetical protein [Oscillospiraceae bacterium]
MIVYGYVKGYMYSGDGTLLVKVRIPSIHGPYDQKEYGSATANTYVSDADLPYYQSLLLPHLPLEGEVAMLMSINEKSTEFVMLGITGGQYKLSSTNNQG